MNQVPDKPGLYWARSGRGRIRPAELYLVEVSGEPPFLEAMAICVQPSLCAGSFKVKSDTLHLWQWLGQANVPGQEGE